MNMYSRGTSMCSNFGIGFIIIEYDDIKNEMPGYNVSVRVPAGTRRGGLQQYDVVCCAFNIQYHTVHKTMRHPFFL